MILQLSPFFSIVVLSLAMRCKEVVNGFHCKGARELSLPQSKLDQCKNNDSQVVCMHSFNFSAVFSHVEVKPQIITNDLTPCENSSTVYRVYCDNNDCEVDAITAAKRCDLKNVQICGGKVQKSEDTEDKFAACMIVFNRPSVASHSNILSEWHRVDGESGKMATTNNREECNEDGSRYKIFCNEDGCDERSDEKILRDVFADRTIICNNTGYFVNSQELKCLDPGKNAACAVTIQIVNGRITRSTSLSIESTAGNHCSSVNPTTQSFVSVCYGDNCDKSPEEIHAKNCEVKLLQCWTNYHFVYQLPPMEKSFCVFSLPPKNDDQKKGNFSFQVELKHLEKPLKSFCDRSNRTFYCEKNCQKEIVNDSLAKCLFEKEEEKEDEDEEDTSEKKSRSRLIINITMVVIFLLLATAVFSGGLIALRNAQRAIAYKKEKYQAEFGVSFGESEPEDAPMEVKKEGGRKREGRTKTGGTSVTGQTTVKTKTTTKQSTPEV